jgi:hypothetical protein
MNGHVLQKDFAQYSGIITPSWMKELWRFLTKHDICVEDDLPGFGYLREHNILLMEVFTELGFSTRDLGKLNVCWLHLQVMSLAEITDGRGERITQNTWTGARSITSNQYTWGIQPHPLATFWIVWRRALAMLCGRDRQLLQPLGKWNGKGCNHWLWWYDEITETLYRREKGVSVRYPEKSARNTRQVVWIYVTRPNTGRSTAWRNPMHGCTTRTVPIVSKHGAATGDIHCNHHAIILSFLSSVYGLQETKLGI